MIHVFLTNRSDSISVKQLQINKSENCHNYERGPVLTFYLDVIWGLNFLFDSLLLYLTAIVLKRRIKYWRLLLGGFVGSLIIWLSITPFYAYMGNPFVKILFSLIMVLIVFGYKRFNFFIKTVSLFYFLTFLIGGILLGTHYFIHFDLDLSNAVMIGSLNGFGDPISWLFVFIGFPLAWHFSKGRLETIEITKIQYEQIVDIHIKIGKDEMTCKGLVDSGNQLYDPLSKKPVMIVSLKNIEENISPFFKKLTSLQELLDFDHSIPPEFQRRIRFIPYQVVGHKHQLIAAIRPDYIQIVENRKSFIVKNGLVAFTMQELSSDGTFDCIVHPKMFMEGSMQGRNGSFSK